MDKKELRERMGTTHHFHPEMNPHPDAKLHWWNSKKKSEPLQINRQRSSTLEDTSSSPVASPASPSTKTQPSHWSFDFSKQRARSFSADEHKDSVLT